MRETEPDARAAHATAARHPFPPGASFYGLADSAFRMEKMILTLRPGAAQELELQALLEAQQDPESPEYHQWLTPEAFASRFGLARQGRDKVVSWLSSQGFQIEESSAGARSVIFSGTAGQVKAAFKTSIQLFQGEAQTYHGNAEEPAVPSELTELVGGVVSLDDFGDVQGKAGASLTPQLTYGGSHFLAPADFATIYDILPLYASGVSGAGQTIAVAARSNINLSDVAGFRAYFGLNSNLPVVTVNGRDPAIVSPNEEAEALLDVEWAGAVAPAAQITLVVSATTSVTDGATLSADYIVNRNLASVMVMPFGICEQSMGLAARNHIRDLWQQAASQGMTVVVSSGDSGAAGCDGFWQTTATHGQAVNGICSTPYNVCVGGTQFNEGAEPNDYWGLTNASWGQGSALRYIPEVTWNESSANGGLGLYGSNGGPSLYYTKPTWQKGLGVPADGKRDVPDISFSAGSRDGYLIMIEGSLKAVGGTSGAASAFAGIAALLNERTAVRQGNILPVLYGLATLQGSGQGKYFNDVQSGNNGVAGVKGFSAARGYDMATGLGSVDANALITQWSTAGTSKPSFTMTATPSPAAVAQNGATVLNVGLSLDSRFAGAVTVTLSGLPAGVQATPASLTATTSGSLYFSVSATSAAAPGEYMLTITGSGNGATMSQAVQLFVTAPANVWNLVWSDEFSGRRGASPDPSNWGFDVGAGGWGNQELQTYTSLPQNASTDGNGNLVIHVDYANKVYKSARLISKGRYSGQYGRIEARVKMPAGVGLWPGFWMLGVDCDAVGWPKCGEVDIMENRGIEPAFNHGSVHGPGYSGGSAITKVYALRNGEAFADNFHVFSVEWSPQAITFFVDGAPYQTATPAMVPQGGSWVFNHPFYLLLNVAVGGTFGGAPDSSTKFPQDMTVDYVRFYQATN